MIILECKLTRKSIQNSAYLLYNILINKVFIKKNTEIIILFNKEDDTNFLNIEESIIELFEEIKRIKISRNNHTTIDNNNTENDYLMDLNDIKINNLKNKITYNALSNISYENSKIWEIIKFN